MRFGNVGRAFLLGTSALVMTSAAAVSADFDIMVDTVANQTLGPAGGETGTVRAGVTLSPNNLALPTVDIIGSNATLTNLGTIAGGGGANAVRATNSIVGVSVTNSGTISGGSFSALFIGAGSDITGGWRTTRAR
jgi:hypothetical protein